MKFQLTIPPVIQGLAASLMIWVFNEYMPLVRLQFVHQTTLAAILGLAGIVVAVAGVRAFIKLRTTLNPHAPEKATSLVVIGIYKYSRNPMYLGILLVLLGVTLYLGAVSAVIVVAGFVVFINKFQIEPEETALRKKFGDSYEQYLKNVGRWM